MVVTTHSHEGGATVDDPPDWLVDVAHRIVDAGAATFIVHGLHRLRGIEIYKGKPIFYSLGDFILQYETTSPQSQDIYDDFGVTSPLALEGDPYDPAGQGVDYSLRPENAHWWDGAVVLPRFRGHDVVSMEILPIELWNVGCVPDRRRTCSAGNPPRGCRRASSGDRRSDCQGVATLRDADHVRTGDGALEGGGAIASVRARQTCQCSHGNHLRLP